VPEGIKTISISASTILRILAVIVFVLLFFAVWQILASVFIAVVIAAALEPTIKWLTSKKIPRFVAVTSIYLLTVTSITAIFYAVLPGLFNEIRGLSQDVPAKYEEFLDNLGDVVGGVGLEGATPGIEAFFNTIQNNLAGFTSDVVTLATSVLGGILTFLLMIVISFYLSLQERGVERFILSFTPAEHKEYMTDFWRRVERRMGRWLQAQFVMAVFIGIGTFLILWLLGVQYAVTIAILAGMLEIIPFIGPVLASIIAFGVISFQSIFLALIAVAALFLLQQFQQYVVIPSVMSRVTGINPVVLIIALVAGFQVAGILGLVVSVPLLIIVGEFFRDLRKG